jgi:pimeloyl-ACP methyl ester carboxylesterase
MDRSGAAARALHRLGAAQVVLLGASEGARASIIAAANPATPATAVVSLSAERYIRGGTDVKVGAARLTRPILFIAAGHDPYAASATLTLYRACGSHDKKLVRVAGAAHVVDLLRGPTAVVVRSDILDFPRRHRR